MSNRIVPPCENRATTLAALSALSHGDRLDILRLLYPVGTQGMAAGDIARSLALSASRLSFHLAQMENAGLIRSHRAARNVIYQVDPQSLGQMIGYLLADCCQAHPEVLKCCRTLSDAAADSDADAGPVPVPVFVTAAK